MNSSTNPLVGLWKPHHLKNLYYGRSVVANYLVQSLPTPQSKAFIITGSSLATKSPLVNDLQKILTSTHHAGTFSNIRQHAPIAEVNQAADAVAQDPRIDTLISLGGGSPIDAAKVIMYFQHQKTPDKPFMTHITIPTTLSAAECTALAGYTNEEGVKTAISHPALTPSIIFYDPAFAAHTPTRLWLATGMRAMDHAMETMYHPETTELPARAMAQWAAGQLFETLPKAKDAHPNDEDLSTRLFLAAFASLGFVGLNLTTALGLSHTLGYALGSPYGIPHGETSCMTLGSVMRLKSLDKGSADQVARMLPAITQGRVARSGDDQADASEVGRRIDELVKNLGMRKGLEERGISKGEIGIIVKRATGGKADTETMKRVEQLVEGLFY